MSFAGDASEAVAEIERIGGADKTVAISKSAAVAQELVPALRNKGFHVVDSYYGEIEPHESRFNEYWQLPKASADTLAESFTSSDLIDLRQRSIRQNGAKNFVGLLGVNAISASDGSVFLMQHLHNVAKIYQQARKLVLVVGLDKICKDRSSALFQTACMGLFGWEVRLLRLGSRAAPEASIDDIPFETQVLQDDCELHIIILDNGRRAILQGEYKDLFKCIGCRACIKNCPTYRFFGEEPQWSPKEYLYYRILGQNPSINLCLGCGMCEVECPAGIDIPAMMMRARSEFEGAISPTGHLLGNFEMLSRLGCIVPGIANAVLNKKPVRWFVEKTLGISKGVAMPQFRGETFSKWFKSSHPGGWERT
ncbi:4Fe-4S dicluster domain-containing protein [Chloroflexota bacterium]